MLKLIQEKSFDKDIELAIKRHKNMQKIWDIINLLVKNKQLPSKNRNHKLQGKFIEYWECHIEPDWLLIYRKTSEEIILSRTGSHADLF